MSSDTCNVFFFKRENYTNPLIYYFHNNIKYTVYTCVFGAGEFLIIDHNLKRSAMCETVVIVVNKVIN